MLKKDYNNKLMVEKSKHRELPWVKTTVKMLSIYIGVMAVLGLPTKTYAESSKTPNAVINVSETGIVDQESLKKQFLNGDISKNNGDHLNNVDPDKSVALVFPKENGTAKISVYPAVENKKGEVSLNAKPIVGQAFINTKKKTAPTLELKSDNVVINNGDTFNQEAFISQAETSDGKLPALEINGNVDTATDGNYAVTYKAIDTTGLTTQKTLQVTVKTPDEVIEARRIAEEQAKAEEEARAKAEAEAKEMQEAALQAANANQQQIANAQQAQGQSPAAAGIGSGGSATGQAIVATARGLIGSPYVAGGASPMGFDCSGFTQYVFGLNGIGINRTAASQAGNGTKIDASQARAGDLMLWTGHAAIYEGNGYVIHATNPRFGVKESSVNAVSGSGSFLGFYRINGVN